MTRILGIDPGLTGALALWDDDLNALSVWDMPTHRIVVGKSRKHVLNEAELSRLISQAEPDLAVCEWVHAMPKQGVTSVFTFGVAFGIVRGILAASNIPVTYTTPQAWQRRMNVGKGADASRQRATQLLPRFADRFARAKDHGRSDAALIALASASAV